VTIVVRGAGGLSLLAARRAGNCRTIPSWPSAIPTTGLRIEAVRALVSVDDVDGIVTRHR